MENRNGLCAEVFVNAPNGAAEWDAALAMLRRIESRQVLGIALKTLGDLNLRRVMRR